uniref:Xylose isomerase-like TIM barrel domain-containing protein n=1 Tax=Ditylenchus dipsaci TaxID=166011 RepID=A0A915DC24_9BILA
MHPIVLNFYCIILEQQSSMPKNASSSSVLGVENAVFNAVSMGCRSFALFIRNQRQWKSKPMEESAVEAWNEAIKATGFSLDQIIPHGSYLMNPGSPEAEKLGKTREAMLDECQRCERLGIKMYNFHPGSSVGKSTRKDCLKTVAETIDYIHSNTDFITLVVETMAGSGHTVGGTFQDLSTIIDQVADKKRVGVCIDTCHIFASGYDLRTQKEYDKTMDAFHKEVDFKYLKAVHLNDSKEALFSCKDRHANIGKGQLGLISFSFLMNDRRFDSIPMVLETPEGSYPHEMKELYQLQNKR